jgi:hypothetical protein
MLPVTGRLPESLAGVLAALLGAKAARRVREEQIYRFRLTAAGHVTGFAPVPGGALRPCWAADSLAASANGSQPLSASLRMRIAEHACSTRWRPWNGSSLTGTTGRHPSRPVVEIQGVNSGSAPGCLPRPGLSFGLIHPRPGAFTSGRGPPVRAGQERSRPVVDARAQSSKACEGATSPWVQIPPPPLWHDQRQIDRAVRAQQVCERDHRGSAAKTYPKQA